MTKITLRVAKAKHRDAGRSISRIGVEDMEKLGLVSGDIIQIQGKKAASAIVWPGYPEDEKGILRIDGNIRSNAGVGIDDVVKVWKVEVGKAKKITLAPTEPIRLVRGSEYLRKVLEGRPIIEGQTIRVEMLGSPLTFVVTKTAPRETVIVTRETQIFLKKRPLKRVRGLVTYEDIGGLKKEVGLVREMIELPLRYPGLFQRIGIDPPKGVLLHGPPGCGKTLLAKAVANEVDANFFSINGPEIISKWYGQSEQMLREVFDEAEANSPAIIFIDEIDSIAPKRSEMTGERQLERRVVSQLLALMDGLKARGEVIVIAATNKPNILDEALRRPGRFDREIEIGIPDRKGRLEILQIHTRGMPLSKDVDLKELADRTHGFVGADIEALCKESGMHALRKIFPTIDMEKEISPEVVERLEVTKKDFREVLKNIEPSAMREAFVEIPKVKWEDIGGLEKVKRELIETVDWPLRYPSLYEFSKTEVPKGILLEGSPGTGKTLLAKALASESEINFISIKGPELMSKFIGESERAIREIFRKARQASPCILFWDELDAIAPLRGAGVGDAHTTERVISQLLTEMDGIEGLKGVVVLGATNRLDLIDPALLRPGRFDRIISIGLPDRVAREEIFRIHTKGKPISGVDLALLAKETEGFSGADIAAVCKEASMLAIREFIESKKDKVKVEVKKFRIKTKHFNQALQEITLKKKGKTREVKTAREGQKFIAKMDKEDMEKARVKVGDVIQAEVAAS